MEVKMDTNQLVLWGMGAALITVGLPLFYVARYLLAPEDQKTRKARDIKGIAIVWVVAGVLIYARVLLARFL
jgi:hypothetical protein